MVDELIASLNPAPQEPDTRPVIWTDEQCFRLNAGQHNRMFHPYTCGTDSRHPPLIATRRGWRCAACGYKQSWSHATGGPDAKRADTADLLLETLLGAIQHSQPFAGQDLPDEQRISFGFWEGKRYGPREFRAVLSATVGEIRRALNPEYRKGEDLSGTI